MLSYLPTPPSTHPESISSFVLLAMYIGQTFSAFRAQVYSSDKLRGWISWLLLIFFPILKCWCFLNFRMDMLKSKLLGISSLAKEIRVSHVLLTSLYQEDEIQPQVRAALWECIFQIRSHWSLTGEVISRRIKSAISSFSPVSQRLVGNSDSQLGLFTMWQAQRHF